MIDVIEMDFLSIRRFGLNSVFDQETGTLWIDSGRDKSEPLTPVRFADLEELVQQAEVGGSLTISCFPFDNFPCWIYLRHSRGTQKK